MKFPSFRIALAALLISGGTVYGLPNEIRVGATKGVFLDDPQIREVYSFWVSYLNSRPDSTYDSPFWNSPEKARYQKADLFRSWNATPNLYTTMREFAPKVLGISREGEYFKITTLFPGQKVSGVSDSLAITNIYAKKTNGKFTLYNALQLNTKDWQHHSVGNITFICPQYHIFNEQLAEKLDRFADSLAAHFSQAPKHIDYYFANTYSELTHARGFDYLEGESTVNHPQGYSEVHNSIVTASGSGEWYPHEFVHMYAFTPYPTADRMLHEGLATYFGGSHNHSLDWIIVRADSLVHASPDLDLNQVFADSRNIALDDEVGSDYIFGGILTKIIYEKGGWNLLKKLMVYGPTPQEGRFAVLKDFFGVDPKDAGIFMKTMISAYAKRISTAKLVSDFSQ